MDQFLRAPPPPTNEFECSGDGKNLNSSSHATVHRAKLSWGSDVPYGGEQYEYLPTPVVQVEKPLSVQQYQDTEVGPPGLGGRGLIHSSASFPKSIKGTRFLLGSTIPRDIESTGTPSAKPVPLPTLAGSWCTFPSMESRARPSRDCPQRTVQGLGELTN